MHDPTDRAVGAAADDLSDPCRAQAGAVQRTDLLSAMCETGRRHYDISCGWQTRSAVRVIASVSALPAGARHNHRGRGQKALPARAGDVWNELVLVEPVPRPAPKTAGEGVLAEARPPPVAPPAGRARG